MPVTLPQKRFYMLRHGESLANAEGTIAGGGDSPLTNRGREMARNLRTLLADLSLKPAAVAHSHLSRAKETAEILNHGLDVETVEIPELGERSFGDWTGAASEQVFKWIEQGETPPNGETTSDFISRALKGLCQSLKGPETMLIVSHGGIFDAFAMNYGRRLENVSNCELYEFIPKEAQKEFPWDIRRHTLPQRGTNRAQSHFVDVKKSDQALF